jgi:hypothetical protein
MVALSNTVKLTQPKMIGLESAITAIKPKKITSGNTVLNTDFVEIISMVIASGNTINLQTHCYMPFRGFYRHKTNVVSHKVYSKAPTTHSDRLLRGFCRKNTH